MRGKLSSGWGGGSGGGNGGGIGRKSDLNAAAGEVACAARDVEMSQNPRGGGAAMPPMPAAPQSVFAGADGGSLGSGADPVQVRQGLCWVRIRVGSAPRDG